MAKVFIAVLVATIALIVVFQVIDTNNKGTVITNPGNTTSLVDTSSLTVSISGEVTRPGTYYLDLNSTLTSPESDSEKNTQIGDPGIPEHELTKDAHVL